MRFTALRTVLMAPDPDAHGGGENAPDPDLAEFANRGQAAQAAADEFIPDQEIKLRASPGASRLGVVVNRRDGSRQCEQMQPRHALSFTLKPGDLLVVLPLIDHDRDEFLRAAGMQPARDVGVAAEIVDNPGVE